MANKNVRHRTKILCIKPWVLFRASHFLTVRSSQKVAIHIKNLEDDAHYEFKGRTAYLWLLLDGVRSVDQVIRQCKKRANIKDPKFAALARQFMDGLLDANLVMEIPRAKKDVRARDMEEFLSLIKKNSSIKQNRGHIVPKWAAKRNGDRAGLMEVRKKFSKLFESKARLKIKRDPSSFMEKLHIFKSELSWPGQKLEPSTGWGASLTVEGAAMAATGEAVERLGVPSSRAVIHAKSYEELKKLKQNALDPNSYRIFAPDQDLVKNQEVTNLRRDTKTDWRLFEDAHHPEQKILIAQDLNLAKLQKSPNHIMYELNSNGCAADTEPERAKLKAALELIERDNVLFYWRTRNTPALIDLSKPHDRIGKLLEMTGAMKKRIRLFYLQSELSPVTVQATVLGDPTLGEPRFAHTAATRLDPIAAMEKALIELLYVVGGFKTGSGAQVSYGKNFENSIWDFGDRADLYGYFPMPDAYKFLFSSKPSMIQASDIAETETGDSKKNLKELARDFRRHGLRLYYEDTTPECVRPTGFYVYRAFSPDLISLDAHHRFRMLGFPRYYKLPAMLGLKRKPKDAGQLNPWPHPIT